MRNVEVAVASTPVDLDEVYRVRHAVFVDEQRVPIDIERDEQDATADHLLARVDGRALGAGRLVAGAEGVGVLGRLAVLPEARGTGLGVQLVRAIEKRARERGLRAVELHSQTHARVFYERLGYVAFGDEYDEAGIPHISMRKTL